MIIFDSVSFFITQIRNAQKTKQLQIKHPYTSFLYSISKILYSQGYIRGYFVQNNTITVLLKYISNKSVINSITRISKPSRRVYFTYKQLLAFREPGNLICTNKYGVMSHKSACTLKTGAEILFKIE